MNKKFAIIGLIMILGVFVGSSLLTSPASAMPVTIDQMIDSPEDYDDRLIIVTGNIVSFTNNSIILEDSTSDATIKIILGPPHYSLTIFEQLTLGESITVTGVVSLGQHYGEGNPDGLNSEDCALEEVPVYDIMVRAFEIETSNGIIILKESGSPPAWRGSGSGNGSGHRGSKGS